MEMFENNSQKGYISLANKYRPQTFKEVVGQDSVSKTLMNAVKSGRIAHAYLFYGPRGCGKTTTARLLAKALNCTGHADNKPTDEPCGKCPQCLEIAASSDMDVLELDAASNTQVERVREAIIDTVALSSGRDRFKVFILDEVHMLSTSSFNALLKTIEEPPSHVVFILATTELHKVPLTISSRCQTFRFKPITEEEITGHLMDLAGAESIDLEEDAAKIIAKSAGGALRDALTIFDRAISFSDGKVDKDLVSEMLGILPQDLIKNAALAVVNKDAAALHKVFETVQSEGFDALGLLKDLKNAFGEIFYLTLNAGHEPFPGAKDILAQVSPGYIAGLTRKISKLIDEVRFSDTIALSSEVGLFTIMDSSLDIENFISRLEALETGSYSGGTSGEKKTLISRAESEMAVPAPKKVVKATVAAETEYQKYTPSAKEPLEKPSVKIAEPIVTFKGEPSEMWLNFKKELSNNFPFLYESIQDITINFHSVSKWTLNFKSKDSFFKDTVARRLRDFEAVSLKLFGHKVEFELLLEAGPSEEEKKVFSAPKKQVFKSVSPVAAKSVQAAVPAAKEDAISKEEPFLAGDYSSFACGTGPAEAGEAAKRILNIFEGQIVEAL